MNEWLVGAPLAAPIAGAVAAMSVRNRPGAQRAAGLLAAIAQLVSAVALLALVERDGIQVLQLGGWGAPFGISFVADRLAAVMVCFGALLGASCTWYAAMAVDRERTAQGYFVLSSVLMAGVAGAFLTGDVFNLYVWIEVMLIASFVLLAMGGAQAQVEGAVKYVTVNLIASAMLLAGVGLMYALAGTLNMADLSVRLAAMDSDRRVAAAAVLLLVAFGIKAAVFPLFAWLPASYHTPPADVSAFFSGLLTKVGVYAIIRTVTLLLPEQAAPVNSLILSIAALTMVVGVMGALAQLDFRRLLSFHIVSQIGYMLMGLGLATPLGLAGAVFYMTQHMVTKTALFLVAAVVERERGTGWLADLGGLGRQYPAVAAVFGIAALSLAGMPPAAGFVAKLTLSRAGLEIDALVIVGIGLAVSLLTLLSMSKIWLAAFWQRAPASTVARHPGGRRLILPAASLAAIAIGLGVAGGPYLDLMLRTGDELMNRQQYISAVLDGSP